MEYKAITEEQMPLLPKRPYIHIPDCKRQILINKAKSGEYSLKVLSEELNINYSTCKTILATYRLTGRTIKKLTRDRKAKIMKTKPRPIIPQNKNLNSSDVFLEEEKLSEYVQMSILGKREQTERVGESMKNDEISGRLVPEPIILPTQAIHLDLKQCHKGCKACRGAGTSEIGPFPEKDSEFADQKPNPKAGPNRTSIASGGKRRVHYTFPSGLEISEEYDLKTVELLSRKIKHPREIGEGKWEYELGGPNTMFNPDKDLMAPSTVNPIFMRKDTNKVFQWRIRNLKWPEEVYVLDIDEDKQEIIIKTTVKKYYKKFGIPDMKRSALSLEKEALSWIYQNTTLIISYVKPPLIIQQEGENRLQVWKEIKEGGAEEGKADCPQQ